MWKEKKELIISVKDDLSNTVFIFYITIKTEAYVAL